MNDVISSIAPGFTRNGSGISKQVFTTSNNITEWIAQCAWEIIAHKQGLVLVNGQGSMALLLGKTYIEEAFVNAVRIHQVLQMQKKAIIRILEVESINGMLSSCRNKKPAMINDLFVVIGQDYCSAISAMMLIDPVEVDKINR
jgi:hypothetical protein